MMFVQPTRVVMENYVVRDAKRWEEIRSSIPTPPDPPPGSYKSKLKLMTHEDVKRFKVLLAQERLRKGGVR